MTYLTLDLSFIILPFAKIELQINELSENCCDGLSKQRPAQKLDFSAWDAVL